MLQHYTAEHPSQTALNIQIKSLETQRTEIEKELKMLPATNQVIDDLVREVDLSKARYLNMLQKIQELKLVRNDIESGVHIIYSAIMPDAPLPSKNIKIYMGSIILGLILSVMLILGRKLIIPRVDDPYWVEKHFNPVNRAIIPYSKQQAESMESFKNDKLKEMPLLVHVNVRNLSIEPLLSLRANLQNSLVSASNNIISMMSVTPGVGKSFVTANLAYILAAGGKRVLLIDGDLRQGKLHNQWNVPPTPGLTDVINKSATLQNAVTITMHKNLSFLPRGAYSADPGALLISDEFKGLMASLTQQYDIIMIDTSPVLSVTDASLIGSISATNYLILGAGTHQPAEIEMVLKRLSGSGVQVHGTIFNFYRPETIMRSHGQYGRYGVFKFYNVNYG